MLKRGGINLANLKMLMAYFCKYYPYKDDISKARLNKMIYLADWKSAIESGSQLSEIHWLYNNYGPYVNEVANLARNDDWFVIYNTYNSLGHKKNIIYINNYVQDSDIILSDVHQTMIRQRQRLINLQFLKRGNWKSLMKTLKNMNLIFTWNLMIVNGKD